MSGAALGHFKSLLRRFRLHDQIAAHHFLGFGERAVGNPFALGLLKGVSLRAQGFSAFEFPLCGEGAYPLIPFFHVFLLFLTRQLAEKFMAALEQVHIIRHWLLLVF